MLVRLRAALRGEALPWSPPILTSEDARKLWSMIEGAGAHRDDQKLLYILRSCGARGRDVLVAAHVVVMRCLGDPTRHSYYSRGAPHVMSELMRAMDVAVIERPLVGIARGGRVWQAVRRDVADELVWILPSVDRIELRFRPVHGERPPHAIPIPDEGPLALPEPWSFSRPRATFVESDPPGTRCPHCGVRATRHRALWGGALVCPACGGSFDDDAGGSSER